MALCFSPKYILARILSLLLYRVSAYIFVCHTFGPMFAPPKRCWVVCGFPCRSSYWIKARNSIWRLKGCHSGQFAGEAALLDTGSILPLTEGWVTYYILSRKETCWRDEWSGKKTKWKRIEIGQQTLEKVSLHPDGESRREVNPFLLVLSKVTDLLFFRWILSTPTPATFYGLYGHNYIRSHAFFQFTQFSVGFMDFNLLEPDIFGGFSGF